MATITLTGRLKMLADFIDTGAHVADIGTDHGYLPLFLLQNGRCQSAIATDINPGPLKTVARSAKEAGLSDQIDLRLGDGLMVLTPGETDTVVIAGMGGETIQNILAQAPWVLSGDIRLILQPQSKLPELLIWLHRMGYSVSRARLAEERGRIYLVLQTGRGHAAPPKGATLYVPQALADAGDPLLEPYIAQITQKLQKAADGLKQSKAPGSREEELRQLIRALSQQSNGGYTNA